MNNDFNFDDTGNENHSSEREKRTTDLSSGNNANQGMPTDNLPDSDYILGSDFFLDSAEDSSKSKQKNKRKKTQKKGCLVVTVWVSIIAVISIGLAGGLIVSMSDVLGIGKDEICTVEIKKGMSTKEIAEELKESGAINVPILFRLYSKIKEHDGTYKYGLYEFNNDIGYEGIVGVLQTEGAQGDTVDVRIPEMAKIDDIMKVLEEKGVCTKAEFIEAMGNFSFSGSSDASLKFIDNIPIAKVNYRFEGYLFPDTYTFFKDDSKNCAYLAIEKMLKQTRDKYKHAKENFGASAEENFNMHQILTMASIIELEASSHPEEMANVAAVFYNRLEWDEPKLLGSSPTMYYPNKDKPNKRYDTNKTEGLPPGPLCAPSLNAIKAALNPTPGFTATYFVTDSNMKFYYNESLGGHNQTIKTLKAQGKWLG